MKLLDQFGNVDERQTRWVILNDTGTEILGDPGQQGGHGIYSTTNKDEAERMKLICRKDFGNTAHVVDLATAVVTLGKNRYGLDFKRPITWSNVKRQLTQMLKEGKL